jgi:hypothetical protein
MAIEGSLPSSLALQSPLFSPYVDNQRESIARVQEYLLKMFFDRKCDARI